MNNDFFYDMDTIGNADRVDGKDKVTGKARYAAEHSLAGMTYGVLVSSNIAKGKIKALDTVSAMRAPGVLTVLSHLNAVKPSGYTPVDKKKNPQANNWEGLKVFYDNTVYSNGQPIALVVADTYERAVYAASLVKAQYERQPSETDFMKNLANAVAPKEGWNPATYQRGQADAYKTSPVQIEAEYILPIETHNPMELFAITADWKDDTITVYDKTQGIKDTQASVMKAFDLPESKVKVVAEYVGGGFGSALRTWPHEIAAIMASRAIRRPVKLMLTRSQMFSMVGFRPFAWQKIGLGATADGQLTGISHSAVGLTSSYENFTEGIVGISKYLYASPNVNTDYKILPLDINTPIWMRGPGEATGCFALESALDELSYKLKMDPIQLRLKNYAETDPEKNLPFSSKFLRECYALGAGKIGWDKRNAEANTTMENGLQVGYGLGCGVFGAYRDQASAKGIFKDDGTLVLQSAVSDMGPGTATAMVSIATDAFQWPAEKIVFELGHSSLPPGPTQGGSATTSTLGSAINDVCKSLQQKLKELLIAQKGSPFENKTPADIIFENGNAMLASDHAIKISYTDILKENKLPSIEILKESKGGDEQSKYSMYSFSVHFVKVSVHPLTKVVRVTRVVTVADAGKIVSEKTARSQMIGGAVGGIGMALTEETIMDHRYGRYVNNNFADYHVPVNADVPYIDAFFINKPDPVINPMGAKGMGEIALIGFAAAVANAVYHATGKRVRELPITADKLL